MPSRREPLSAGDASVAEPAPARREGERRALRLDLATLALATGVPALVFAAGLGFYSDDWAFLSWMHLSPDQSVPGLFRASCGEHFRMRPVQPLLMAALYSLFGLSPEGFHRVNAGLLVATVLLLHVFLRQVGVPRACAAAAALLYGTLPSFSSVRFWPSAFTVTLAMATGLAGLVLVVRGLRASRAAFLLWLLLGVAAMAVSGLAYEVQIPAFLCAPAVAVARARHDGGPSRPAARRRAVAVSVAVLGVVAALGAYKALTTVRGTVASDPVYFLSLLKRAFDPGHDPAEAGLNLKAAVATHFGVHVVGMPRTVASILGSEIDPATLAMSVFATVASLVWIRRVARESSWPPPRRLVRVVLQGAVGFALGYAIFLTNPSVHFARFGIGNRAGAAAAAGAALTVAGAAGLISSLRGLRRAREWVLAAIIAALAGGGTLIMGTVATFWREAYARERQVLERLSERLPDLPPRTTLLLDGVAPYVGPAIVFESAWDLEGALRIDRHDPTLTADVLSGNVVVTDDSLVTILYHQRHAHPYGSVIVHHLARNLTVKVDDADAARSYMTLRESFEGTASRTGLEGHGSPVFGWR